MHPVCAVSPATVLVGGYRQNIGLGYRNFILKTGTEKWPSLSYYYTEKLVKTLSKLEYSRLKEQIRCKEVLRES